MGSAMIPESQASTRGSDLERWLRSPLRRRSLIALGVVALAGASTWMWVDAFRALDRTPEGWFEPWRVFVRRLLGWGMWGALVEPIAWLSHLVARWVRRVPPQIVIHALVAVGLSLAVGWVDDAAGEALFSPGPRPDWSARGRPMRPPELDGPSPEREERRERGDPERSSERQRDRDLARSRFTRSRRIELGVLTYAALLAMGSGVRSFLAQRDREKQNQELEVRALRLEGELSRARLASLESQLHPHFLFNALHSVGGLVRAAERDRAIRVLSALGDLLRTTLEHQGEDEVPIHEELALVERYLEIERIRLGERLQAVVESEPGVGRARVPTLLLLPLVENAVRYAVAARPEGGRIAVRALHQGGGIAIEVQDDGPGFPPEVLAGGEPRDGRKHIGLANSAARLRALHGERARFELSNPPGGGALVRIELPLTVERGES